MTNEDLSEEKEFYKKHAEELSGKIEFYRKQVADLDAYCTRLKEVLKRFEKDKSIKCFCGVALNNPMYGGEHSEACKMARKVLYGIDP